MLICLLLLWFQTPQAPVQQHARKGFELAQKGDLKSAEAELRQALRLSPNDAVSAGLLGLVLAKQDRLGEASAYLQKALKIDPGDSGTRCNLAAVQFRLGEASAGKKNLQLVLRARPDHQAAIALGHEAATGEYRANRFAASQSTLEDLLAAGARDARLLNLLAWCYHRQNKLSDAVDAMKKAIELEPTETNYNHLAQILLDRRQNVAAAEAVNKALELAPNSFQAHKLKGRMEMQIGNSKRALESFTRAVELNDRDPESLLGLGLTQERLFRYQEAAASFEKGIARFPSNPLFFQSYGRMLLEPGTAPDAAIESRAVSLLEKALALDNSLSEAHYQLGKLLLGKGEVEKALVHLDAAAKLNPQSSRIHLSLANAYRRLGRGDDAAKEIRLMKSLPNREEDPD